MKKTVSIFTLMILITACGDTTDTFHHQSFVADTHNDVLLRVMQGEDISQITSSGHSDIPRMLEGGIDAQVFSIWVNPTEYGRNNSYNRAIEMIEALENIQATIPNQFEIAKSYDDLLRIEKAGKLAGIIGVEGGHAIENVMINLIRLYRRGMRYLTLTWNNSTRWATSALDETKNEDIPFRGLTDFGRKIVKKCNELGIMIDVSHLGEQAFWDVIETTTQPIIASHSCVYSLCPHFRNLKDDQLKAIKDNGGVVFVNFYPGYLDSTFKDKADAIEEAHQRELDSLKALYDEESDDYWYGSMAILGEELAKAAPTVDAVIDHIDYIAKLIGVDHVGLGSDFDGVSVLPKGLEDCTKMPVITRKLLHRGYSKEDVRKILGENFRRIFKEVVG